jgi:hypothetical protein
MVAVDIDARRGNFPFVLRIKYESTIHDAMIWGTARVISHTWGARQDDRMCSHLKF